MTDLATRPVGFELGQWHVTYVNETRYLTVEIVLNSFYQDIGKYSIVGNNHDILKGTISEDGSIWKAERYNYDTLIILTPEPNELHNLKKPIYKGQLVFRKVKE